MSRKIYTAITNRYHVAGDANDSALLRHSATIEWYSREGDSAENSIPSGVLLNIRGVPHRYALVQDDIAMRNSGEGMPVSPHNGYAWTRENGTQVTGQDDQSGAPHDSPPTG